MTQKEIIKKYLEKENRWIPAYKLRSVDTEFGWLGFQADRRCREMAKAGEIERKIEGKYVFYRAKSEYVFTTRLRMTKETNQLSLI